MYIRENIYIEHRNCYELKINSKHGWYSTYIDKDIILMW